MELKEAKSIRAAESIIKSVHKTDSIEGYEKELLLIANILDDFYGEA
jgi:hypothetical protein